MSNQVVLSGYPFSYVGPGDSISLAATAWWGLRAYNIRSIGRRAIRLIRDSDNAEQDFATTFPSGNLDTTAITAFKGAANLTVRTIYDQTGSALHLSPPGGKASFILSGLGSLPIMTFGSGITYSTPNFTLAQPFTLSTVHRSTSGADEMLLISNSTGVQARPGFGGANKFAIYAGSGPVSASATDNVWHAIQSVFNGASSDICVDGASNSVSIGGSGISSEPVIIGNGANFTGSLFEMGIFAGAFTSGQKTAMNSNQHGLGF